MVRWPRSTRGTLFHAPEPLGPVQSRERLEVLERFQMQHTKSHKPFDRRDVGQRADQPELQVLECTDLAEEAQVVRATQLDAERLPPLER
jgi:hypothetical protein